MMEIVTILCLLLFCFLLLNVLNISGISEAIVISFCISTAYIVGMGLFLSWLNRLGDLMYWTLLSILSTAGCYAITSRNKPIHFANLVRRLPISLGFWKRWLVESLTGYEKLLLFPLLCSVLLLGGINLVEIFGIAPHNTDSMTYHLARVAYYLQHNNISYFEANYWAQVVHPKNSSILILFTYLVSGKNENLTQLVQYIAYWVAVCSVYALSKKVGLRNTQAIFAASVAALLTEWLMQATTTQNDLLLTAYMGCSCTFLFCFRESKAKKYLVLTALAIGLSFGVKASSLIAYLPVGLIAAYLLFTTRINWKTRLFNTFYLTGFTILAIGIFALPSGYIENIRTFNHPIGPSKIREMHTFEGRPFLFVVKNGTKNMFRYGLEFLSLDGFPPSRVSAALQAGLRYLPEQMLRISGVNLETAEASRRPFRYEKDPVAHEDFSYWGIFGFALVWVFAVLALLGLIKSPDIRVLALAAVVFFLVQSYSGPYDPWRGRYFAVCAIFAVPAVGTALISKSRIFRLYLLAIVTIGCVSAISAVLFRKNGAVVGLPDQQITALFAQDRLRQMTANRPEFYEPLVAYERLVPQDAKVAVFLYENSYEYPLFGEHLTRTLLPINSFNNGLQLIPAEADYLLYVNRNFPCALPDDIDLGQSWYLRKLSDTNRACSQ